MGVTVNGGLLSELTERKKKGNQNFISLTTKRKGKIMRGGKRMKAASSARSQKEGGKEGCSGKKKGLNYLLQVDQACRGPQPFEAKQV